MLVDALAAHGLSAAFVCWDDPDARWTSAGVVVIRSTWDYHRRLERVPRLGRLRRIGDDAVQLAGRSCAGTVTSATCSSWPTSVCRPSRPSSCWRVSGTTLGPGRHVIKPAVSVGADRTVRNATQADLDALVATDDVLVQPYLSEVETGGELSIVCIDGRPTHVRAQGARGRRLPRAGADTARRST